MEGNVEKEQFYNKQFNYRAWHLTNTNITNKKHKGDHDLTCYCNNGCKLRK